VQALSDADARRGVAAHSSGNHAAARAARLNGARVGIVCSDDSVDLGALPW